MVKLLFLDMDGAGANSAKDVADYVKICLRSGSNFSCKSPSGFQNHGGNGGKDRLVDVLAEF